MGDSGYCLGSKEIRGKVKEGRIIVPEFNEGRIQPSSFEPSLANEVYIIDKATGGIRPRNGMSVYRNLLELPWRKRQRIDITDGFEISRGYTYLFPLQERLAVSPGEVIKSSPKSSYGRLFLNSRLIFDYSPCFDETNNSYSSDELQMWLMVQPLHPNVIVRPGLSLNQLRFFHGLNARLSDSEIKDEFEKYPMLLEREGDNLVPSRPFISDGLQIHLDLKGQNTGGIVALRARDNPLPIDASRIEAYDPEDFFEPIKARDGKLSLKSGEHYLFASREVLDIPRHLNTELKSHSHVGIMGYLHFAGFVDPKFTGDLVFEIRSDEISDVELHHGMPISRLDIYRNLEPDKVYGRDIGSSYQGQFGPRPSKHFKLFDFNQAAKNYGKLDRDVLVQDAHILKGLRTSQDGFEPISERGKQALESIVEGSFFHSRYDCETDESVLQMIPYIVMFGPNQTVFSYVRSENIAHFGEKRLFNKHSIGVGGHIGRADGPDFLNSCLAREMDEEVKIIGSRSSPELVGTLMAHEKPVDRVHFGLIYAVRVERHVEPKEQALVRGSMVPITSLMELSDMSHYETWSKILIPHLESIRSQVYRR